MTRIWVIALAVLIVVLVGLCAIAGAIVKMFREGISYEP